MALFGWLFMNLSGFAFWVVICGSFWFRFLGCHLWLFLILLLEWLYVALSGFTLRVAICGSFWFRILGGLKVIEDVVRHSNFAEAERHQTRAPATSQMQTCTRHDLF